MTALKEYERLDDLQNGFKIIQNPERFCFGTDAVLLSSFANIRKNDRVIDLCTGSGVIPVLLCAHTPAASITGVEIDPDVADMARRSVALNGIENVTIVTGDITDIRSCVDGVFDVVTVNPPYDPDDGSSDISRHEVACDIDGVCGCASRLLVPKGRFYLVYRPRRISELIVAMERNGLTLKKLRFVCPREGRAPSLVLVEGRKHGNKGCEVLPELILYDDGGHYTPEARRFYHMTEGE